MPPPQLPKIDKTLYNQGAAKGANTIGGKIKCYSCNSLKPHSAFSTRQLNNWKATIYQPYAPSGRTLKEPRTTCKNCTPGQTAELTCIVCGETNGLSSFAKAQRKNPDKARCTKCVTKQLDTAPDLEVPDSDEYTSSDADGEADIDFDTGINLKQQPNPTQSRATTSYAASLSQAPPGPMSPPGQARSAAGDDGWAARPASTISRPQPTQTFTYAFDSNDSRSVAGTDDDSSFKTVSRRGKTQETPGLRKNGWAKVEKISKKGRGKFSSFDDEADTDEGDGGDDGSHGEWKDRKVKLKADFDSDPWASKYK
ncbi:hypothetical protein ABW19_dt0200026 [Dactylella cylindrospora]|nr:hypothetical protein ABW19_dt0200026 [Dactylella cylindrospora]